MQILQLSAARLHPFASILPTSTQSDTCACVVHREFTAQSTLEQFISDDPVVLDYVSGMPLLLLYDGTEPQVYYLDRVLQLAPHVRFSVASLSSACQVDFHLASPTALRVVATLPASSFQGVSPALRFDRLYTFFYQECAGNFYFRGEQHEAYELVYVDRGQLHNLVGGKDVLLRQRQLMLIGSHKWHTQYSDQPVSFLTLSFLSHDEALLSLADQVLSPSSYAFTLLRQLLSESSRDAYSYDCAESLLRLLLIDLLRNMRERPAVPDTQLPATRYAEQQTVDRLIRTISANVCHKLTLQELADSVHISVAYMHRLFQAQLGMSPGTYIAKIRIEESKLLLREGALSMGSIAEKMGFSSQQHFSRHFRTVTGMTPSEYVRSLR